MKTWEKTNLMNAIQRQTNVIRELEIRVKRCEALLAIEPEGVDSVITYVDLQEFDKIS